MCSGIDCLLDQRDDLNSYYWRLMNADGWPVRTEAVDDMIKSLATVPARRSPGQAFEFLNINIIALILLVEKISGRIVR